MAAIPVDTYRVIADKYARAQVAVADVSSYYFDAAYEIVILESFDPELDLLAPFYNAYLAARTIFLQAPQSVVQAVNRLQSHVINKAREQDGTKFTDINNGIDASNANTFDGTSPGRQGDVDASFKVAREFAAISGQAGFEISNSNVV